MEKQPLRHEFKVVFEGIELRPEIVDRMNRAVQKVVLQEIANIDLKGDLAIRIPQAMIGNGSTNGIEARIVTPGQREDVRVERPT